MIVLPRRNLALSVHTVLRSNPVISWLIANIFIIHLLLLLIVIRSVKLLVLLIVVRSVKLLVLLIVVRCIKLLSSFETDAFKQALGGYLREGMNYPAARMRAVKELISEGTMQGGSVRGNEGCGSAGTCVPVPEEKLDDILTRPNNILALEYLKALKRLGSPMKPVNIKREAVDHDSANTYGIYSSAGNIRRILDTTRSFDAAAGYLPENTTALMREHFGARKCSAVM